MTRNRRNRGVMLSAEGIQRLNRAISDVETAERQGRRLTMEELSDRTGISTSTLSRLWASKSGVDRRTLRLLFSAFGLDLLDTDIQSQGDESTEAPSFQEVSPIADDAIRYPSGPVPLNSPRYVQRRDLEERVKQEIAQPGCVVRIRAPTGYGKTSLLLRLIAYARQLNYATVAIDLQRADTATLADTSTFLEWFCAVLAHDLGLETARETCRDESLGSKLSTTLYLRDFVLAKLQRPLVIAINEANYLFEHPETARDIFPLLRSWHEEAQHDDLWRQLRLVVVYSTDAYLPLDINQSPFNVGLPVRLPSLSCEDVKQLATAYQVAWDDEICDRLLTLIDGNPTLINIALYYLHEGMDLEQILQSAVTQEGIFQTYLQPILTLLKTNAHWAAALEPLVNSREAIALDPLLAYKLEGMGLIHSVADEAGGTRWHLSCELYRIYLRNYLFEMP